MQVEIKRKVTILISEKIDFVARDKEWLYIMIKRSILQKGIMIINIYAPNIGAPKYIRQLLTALKEEIDSNTITGGL